MIRIKRSKYKLPNPLHAVPLIVQYQRLIRFNRIHGEVLTVTPWNLVTYGEMLELGQNSVCTWTIQKSKNPVKPVITVQTTTLIAHLDKPGPDFLGACINCYSLHCAIR